MSQQQPQHTILAAPGDDPRHPQIHLSIEDRRVHVEHEFVLSPADAVVLIEKIQAALGQAMVAWDAMQPLHQRVQSESERGHADYSDR